MPVTCSNTEIQDAVRRYQTTVYRVALSYTRSIADAEDITQEVFLRALKASPVFCDEEHRKAWFIRVTLNCCKSQLSSYWRRNVRQFPGDLFGNVINVSCDEEYTSQTLESQLSYCAHEDAQLPAVAQESHARRESVLAAVARLPWKQRICVHLFYFEDASIETIASILNMKPATVKSHLYRARLALKATLKEVSDEF